ncbi:MAG: MFS transporter [Firmicutes bacterium]|nr:MFS transporter [Bacillota bacterium]
MHSRPIRPIELLTLATLDQLAVAMSQQGLSVLSVSFKEYAHLGVAQLGILFATVALGAVIGMIPSGIALDRLGSKRIAWISGAAILVVLGTLAILLPKQFWALEILLGFVGFFLPALSLTGMTAITHIFDHSPKEGLVIGIRQSATPLGGILAAALFPFLVMHSSLSMVLLFIAVNAGGWTMLFGWALPPALHKAPAATPSSLAKHPLSSVKKLLHPLKYPALVSFLLSPGQYALLTYAILDLHDRWQISIGIAGPIIALALFGGLLTRILMGKLADKGISTPRLMMYTGSVSITSLLIWAVLPRNTPIVFILPLFFLLGSGLDGWNALLTSWITRNSASSQRGMALGLTGMAGFIGVVLFLPIFGLMIRLFQSYRPIWILLAAIYGVALIVLRKVSLKTS